MSATEDLEELEEMLADVNTAIRKVLQGQSYSLGSRSVTRANLTELRALRDDLKAEIAALEENGTTRRKFARVVPVG